MSDTTEPAVRPGDRFTHQRILAADFKPQRGQKYKDGPKATMVVTAVRRMSVFYREDLSTGMPLVMDRQRFLELYGAQVLANRQEARP